MSLIQAFQYHDEQLFCEDTPLSYVAKKYGTPCYVYSKKALLGNFRYFSRAFSSSDPLICYAVKANSNLSILQLLKTEGSGFDVVSAGELYRLKKIGADPKKIIFSGVGKTPEELSLALEMSLLSINVESYQELDTLVDLANQTQKTVQISLRINPEVNAKTHPYIATGFRRHKFGLDVNSLKRVTNLLRGSKKVRLTGIGFHIGSQILDVQPFLDAFQKLEEIATSLRNQSFEVTNLDLGGGIGIPYADESEPDLQIYADFLEQHQKNYQIIFEPGRFIVGNTGILLNQVLYHKTNHDKRFIIVDGAMNDLIRPALYDAYHRILPVRKNVEQTKADVVGPICETGDFFARDRSVSNVRSGDHLAIMNVGAYGFVAASNYNSRPRPAEILVDGNNSQLIRKRESLDDLLRGEE